MRKIVGEKGKVRRRGREVGKSGREEEKSREGRR